MNQLFNTFIKTMFTEILDQAQKDGIERLNVAIALYNEQKQVLVCQRAKDKQYLPNIWHLPGGKVEQGETIIEAITREVFEELNLNVEIEQYTQIRHDYVGHGTISSRTEFFIGRATGEIKLNHENQAYMWIHSDKVKELFEPHVVEINTKILSLIEDK